MRVLSIFRRHVRFQPKQRTGALDCGLTDGIRAHVESRVWAAVRPVSGWALAAVATLEDVNGGRGGIDKCCRLALTMRHRASVFAEATDADLHAATRSGRAHS